MMGLLLRQVVQISGQSGSEILVPRRPLPGSDCALPDLGR
jgi:hypothetical protein